MKVLIEIGVEELPAIPFLKEYENILPKWHKILEQNSIKTNFKLQFTPRRIVLFSNDFPQTQDDIVIENIGAPKHVAIKDGKWSNAALSFAKKCDISEDELNFKEVKGKEVLYHLSLKKGSLTKDLLKELLNDFLESLNFGKSMRWGEGEFSFIRPIRSLACVIDNELVEMKIYGVKSDMSFFPHRSFGYEKIKFSSIDEYFKLLADSGVILDPHSRKSKILAEISAIESSLGLEVQKDSKLLDEIIAITEYPTALVGKFDESFLELPKEVIITSMKENQRYFPLFNGLNLSPHFIVVSNGVCSDNKLIVAGNERVLKARLSDAMFFWENDLKAEFSAEPLKNITYMNELGSVYDKQIREQYVANNLAKIYTKELDFEVGNEYESKLKRAIMLSKADLTTSMVGEFGELQGLMGSYYAKAKGESSQVVDALKEQYYYDEIPSTIFSSVVNISTKFESIIALFSIGKEPTGTKDPYALRRAALSIIRIVLAKGLNFDVKEIALQNAKEYRDFDIQKLIYFFTDRLNSIYPDINVSIINACLKSGETDLKKLNSAILALDEISKEDSFKDKFSTFKRLANIIKDEDIGAVNKDLFAHKSEQELHNAFKELDLTVKDYKIYLNQLFSLKENIDNFFDNVMINVDDKDLKDNRISLVGQIYKAFLKVADIKEISI
ncbi:MAG: glycine--tRNA ligase subunit beta [Campylobacter sp.]|nr:glycine--tRNA ligase subunit beta [Campylobacter sp.]